MTGRAFGSGRADPTATLWAVHLRPCEVVLAKLTTEPHSPGHWFFVTVVIVHGAICCVQPQNLSEGHRRLHSVRVFRTASDIVRKTAFRMVFGRGWKVLGSGPQ